jgi:hypothetical protein
MVAQALGKLREEYKETPEIVDIVPGASHITVLNMRKSLLG